MAGAKVRNRIEEIEWFMAAIRRLESGSYAGKYTARNPQSGAYGAYQIMPGNWDPWAARWGIAGADRRDPAAQDFVARKQMTRYFEVLGDWKLVAIAWYAGMSRAMRVRDEGFKTYGSFGRELANYANRIISNMVEAPDQYVVRLEESVGASLPFTDPAIREAFEAAAEQRAIDEAIQRQIEQAQANVEPFTPQTVNPNEELNRYLALFGSQEEAEISPLRGTLTHMLSVLSNAVAGGERGQLPAQVEEEEESSQLLEPESPQARRGRFALRRGRENA